MISVTPFNTILQITRFVKYLQKQVINIYMNCQVEAIIGRKVFSGKVLYLTKWKGFPLNEATWESVKVLKPYKKLIKLYNDKLKNSSRSIEPAEEAQSPAQAQQTPPQPEKEINHYEESIAKYLADSRKDTKKQINQEEEARPPRPEPHKAVLANFNEQMAIQNLRMGLAKPVRSRGRPPRDPQAHRYKVLAKQMRFKNVACQVQREETIEDVLQKLMSSREDSTQQEFSDRKRELVQIFSVERTPSGGVQYVIEEKGGHLRKCQTKEMMKFYPELLVRYLEESVLSRAVQLSML